MERGRKMREELAAVRAEYEEANVKYHKRTEEVKELRKKYDKLIGPYR